MISNHKSHKNSYLELQVDSEDETILVGKLSTSANRWDRPQPASMPVAAAAARTACSPGGSLPSEARLGQPDPLKPSESDDFTCSALGAGHSDVLKKSGDVNRNTAPLVKENVLVWGGGPNRPV